MVATSRFVAYFSLGMTVLTWGCGGTGSPGDSGSGATGGASAFGGSTSSGASGPVTSSVCGRSECTADLARASAALEAGDYGAAFEQYQCADTPQAAFGAGLTRTFLILEGASSAALLADFGQPPLRATDIFGASGILSRQAERWQGQGALSLSGAVTLDLAFNRAQQRLFDDVVQDGFGRFVAEDWQTPNAGELSISLGYPANAAETLPSGAELAVSFNCAGTFPVRTVDPRLNYIDLSFELEGVEQWCTLPYFSTSVGCETDGGSVVVNAAASSPGQEASYSLENLLLSCTADSESQDPAVDPQPAPEYLIRVNGSVTALAVSQSLDSSGLHPMFADGFVLDSTPADRTGTDLVQHAGAAALELEEAACFFAKAGQGSGTVFDLPGVLFGGNDLPATRGDSQLLAGLALLGASAAELALAHDIDMPLGQLVCDADASQTPCLGDAEYVTAFNQAFGSAFHPERFVASQRLLAEALPLLDAGIANLDAGSLFVKNDVSSRGLQVLQELVQAARVSLGSQATAVPHVTPELVVNLGAFFADPRNVQSMAAPPLRYVEECELDVCSTTTELDAAFRDEYFAGTIEADWEATYELMDDDAVTDATQEMSRHVGGLLSN